MASHTADYKDLEQPVIEENKIILIWSATVWLVVMNTTMFNVALPSVLSELSLSSSTASWIVSGYSIVFAISTLTYSRLSDFLPIRKLLTLGLALLAISSIIGFFSQDFVWLLAARLLQAAGAGAVPGLAMVLAGRYIPISRRGKAMAFISSAASLGFGLGPVIGGLITQYLGWHYLFVVTGFVLLLLPLFRKLLPQEETQKIKFDYLGGLLIGIGVTGLLLYLSTFKLPILLVSIAALLWLWRHIHKVSTPFIQPALLKNKQFVKLLGIGFGAFVSHFSALFLMPIMLAVIFNKEPATIGLLIFPGAILSAIAAQFIGRFIDRFGNMPLILFGQVFLIISTLSFGLLGNLSPYVILVTYMFMSTGFSALTSSISNEISRILDKSKLGAGMGIAQLVQFFGGAFGVALTGLLIVWQGDLPVEEIYRNIFLGVTGLLLLTSIVFYQYKRSKGRQSI
ncbi:multidrug efflux MFS transporter [Sutcliffiella horikoshii]|uniref:Multidrug efflux MFS transporter n=1 Tax=Sutcliffiella horikoshii TaxID=79883 RepID=A0AA94WTZ7_9BACI|nr:MFS transporter [Sutcliffiella horikoshii]TYS61352.1 multidrug efflux MFS transporter [Sutcliffiella horikoshii]